MRTSLRTVLGLGAALVLAGSVGTASASHTADGATGWHGNTGVTYADGVVTLNNLGGAGTSYENDSLNTPVEDGQTISFEWRSSDVTCAGGTPRVFIQGGAYNTFDADPAGSGACGSDTNDDGWSEVTGTISGATPGPAGHTAIVNDNPDDRGTIQVRNLVIAGVSVLPPAAAEQCKNGGWQFGDHKNQGQCVSSFAKAKNGK